MTPPAQVTPSPETGGPAWTPDPVRAAGAAIAGFAAEAGRRAGLDLGGYRDLHAWSVRDLDAFWVTVADFFGLGLGSGPVLAENRMPGASWFPGSRLSYAARALRPAADPRLADRCSGTQARTG